MGDPVEIDEIGFAGDGAIRNGPRTIHGGLGVDGELDGAVSLVAQELVWIVLGGEIAAVNGQDVVAFLDVDANFG